MLRPSRDDRARVARRLTRHLGAAVILTAPSAFAAPKAPLLSKFSSLVAALGLVAAGATYSLGRPAEFSPVAVAHVSPPAPLVATSNAATPCVAAPAPSEETATSETPASSPIAKKLPVADRLGEEVALLSRATSQLRGGNAASAMELLEQHRRQFPAGRLVEERRAARAQALCALGDRGGAQAELSRLAQTSPRSPHVVRAQRACGL